MKRLTNSFFEDDMIARFDLEYSFLLNISICLDTKSIYTLDNKRCGNISPRYYVYQNNYRPTSFNNSCSHLIVQDIKSCFQRSW